MGSVLRYLLAAEVRKSLMASWVTVVVLLHIAWLYHPLYGDSNFKSSIGFVIVPVCTLEADN